MTELTTAELWQSAPIETELARLRRERAERYWRPTTTVRHDFISGVKRAVQAIKNEDEK